MEVTPEPTTEPDPPVVELQQADTTVSEPNGEDFPEDTTTAGVVVLDSEATGKITPSSDKDWFRINVEAGKVYKIGIRGADTLNGTLWDPLLDGIYDQDGRKISNTSDDDDGSFRDARLYFTASQSGTHYISAAGTNASEYVVGTYKVFFTEVGPDIPADTTTTATVTVGNIASDEIHYSGDLDWYGFEAEAYIVKGLWADRNKGNTPIPYIHRIYDPSGNEILRPGGGTRQWYRFNKQLYFEPTEDATYFIAVGSPLTSSYPTGAYRMQVKEAPFDIPGDVSTTTSAAINATLSGNFEMIGDHDWYSFEGNSDKGYIINVRRTDSRGSTGAPDINGIYDADGNQFPGTSDRWGRETNADTRYNSLIYFEPDETATHYISVNAAILENTHGHYDLEVVEVPLDLPADSSITATVAVGGSYDGWVDYKRDRDWIKATLVAGEEYEIHLKNKPTDTITFDNPHIFSVFDSQGTALAGTEDADSGDGRNAMLSFTASTSGDHYIEVGGQLIVYFLQFGAYILEVVDVDGDGI